MLLERRHPQSTRLRVRMVSRALLASRILPLIIHSSTLKIIPTRKCSLSLQVKVERNCTTKRHRSVGSSSTTRATFKASHSVKPNRNLNPASTRQLQTTRKRNQIAHSFLHPRIFSNPAQEWRLRTPISSTTPIPRALRSCKRNRSKAPSSLGNLTRMFQ